MVAVRVMTVDGGGGGPERGRRQTNLCLEVRGLDTKKSLFNSAVVKSLLTEEDGPVNSEK
jgi:hypothetical protein